MCNIPDALDLYLDHQAREEAELEKFPQCDSCGEYITDDFCYNVNGDLLCEDCMNDLFRVSTDDYIND